MINNFGSKLIEIPGYSFVQLDRNWSENGKSIKKGGGLGIYIKNDLDYCESSFKANNTSTSDLEMQWIENKIKNMKRIILINVYIPPSGIYKDFCKNIYDSITNSAIKDNTDIFIMGDMNIDILDSNSIPKKELINTMQRLGLVNINKNYTRYSKK